MIVPERRLCSKNSSRFQVDGSTNWARVLISHLGLSTNVFFKATRSVEVSRGSHYCRSSRLEAKMISIAIRYEHSAARTQCTKSFRGLSFLLPIQDMDFDRVFVSVRCSL